VKGVETLLLPRRHLLQGGTQKGELMREKFEEIENGIKRGDTKERE